ncbi:hypothetical protein A3Q56_06360 [Intoshia linei]|uniref:CCHC-type domain-containing protein n=1 Tax=Intoshia linei TaxID=1819745 RepID=A0A177AWP4_9BILA|nr:hypothetical protein A3Q56_06360 [Intoshia linei]
MGADIKEAILGITDKQIEGFVEQEVLYRVKQVKPEVAMIARMWATPGSTTIYDRLSTILGGVDLRLEASRDILRTNKEDVKQRNFREWVPKSQLQCHQYGEYGHIARNCLEDTRPWKEKSINGPRSERGM